MVLIRSTIKCWQVYQNIGLFLYKKYALFYRNDSLLPIFIIWILALYSRPTVLSILHRNHISEAFQIFLTKYVQSKWLWLLDHEKQISGLKESIFKPNIKYTSKDKYKEEVRRQCRSLKKIISRIETKSGVTVMAKYS